MKRTILSTADVARLFNVTETTVKRWADEGTLKCQKTPGGHRKYEMKHVVDFADKNNFDPVGTLSLVNDTKFDTRIQVGIISRNFATLADEFVTRALSRDRTDLFMFLSYLYEHRVSLWDIYDLVLRPGMKEIGDRWASGRIGINHEHRASHETLDALARLQSQIHIEPHTGFSVVCACLGEEMHEIGLRCASYLFESEGWTTHYLGARTPVESVLASIEELRPSVACFSVTHPEYPGQLHEHMRRVDEVARATGAAIIAGGSGATRELCNVDSCAGVFSSAREVVDFIHHYKRDRASLSGAQSGGGSNQ